MITNASNIAVFAVLCAICLICIGLVVLNHNMPPHTIQEMTLDRTYATKKSMKAETRVIVEKLAHIEEKVDFAIEMIAANKEEIRLAKEDIKWTVKLSALIPSFVCVFMALCLMSFFVAKKVITKAEMEDRKKKLVKRARDNL